MNIVYSNNNITIGIVGCTGAVGVALISCLHEIEFPLSRLRLFGSTNSSGTTIPTCYGDLLVEEFTLSEVRQCTVVFLAVSDVFANEFALKICENFGPWVIDNSSAFRYATDYPLVVPEINGSAIKNSRLIANPNCTTAIAAMCLWPLHKSFGIKKIIVSTYQAASGAGSDGLQELWHQTCELTSNIGESSIPDSQVLRDFNWNNKIFKLPLPFNLIPKIDQFQENGYTREEMKVAWELRRIFAQAFCSCPTSSTSVSAPTSASPLSPLPASTVFDISLNHISEDQGQTQALEHARLVQLQAVADMKISCTAVRVPVLRAHSEAITVETQLPCPAAAVKELLRHAPGVQLMADDSDDTTLNLPTPLTASGRHDVQVGRVRQSLVFDAHGVDLFVCGDQLYRGAALNAVLTAKLILQSQGLI